MKDIKNKNEKIGDEIARDLGSEEFYQGEKKAEEIDISALKKGVKTEMVKKEDIYGDKMEKHAAFIASLGRKKMDEEKPENDQTEYVEEKNSRGKKTFFIVLSLVVLGALIGGGYFWWLKKQTVTPTAESGKNENTVVIPINTETSSDNSAEEKNIDEKNQTVEVAPADMNVKVLNGGAAAGSAGKIKNVLVNQGYAKTEAGNGQGENIVGSTVYYKGEQFKKPAEELQEILATSKIKSEVKEALTAEQQSADVVVILGK